MKLDGVFRVDGDIVTEPASVSFTNIRPGDQNTAEFVLTNTHDVPMQITGVLHETGEIFTGITPLAAHYEITNGRVCPQTADAVPPHGHLTIMVTATLPAEAGNEYQLAHGQATYYFTATEISDSECFGQMPGGPETPEPSPTESTLAGSAQTESPTVALSTTGSSVLPVFCLPLLLVLGISLVMWPRRTRRAL